jgi:hypothetical protein
MDEDSSDENGYESLDDTLIENGHEERTDEPIHTDSASRYTVPTRIVGAVEIPAVVENADRAVKAFGRVPNLQHVNTHHNIVTVNLANTIEGHGCRSKFDPILSHARKPILQTHHVSQCS